MAQSVKHPTLGLSSGHDLTDHEFEPRVGLCTDSMEPAWDSASPSLCLPLSLSLSLSLSQKFIYFERERERGERENLKQTVILVRSQTWGLNP